MSIRVEFYGIPRQRAGVASLELAAGTLGDVIDRLQAELPALAAACLDEGQLQPGYLANINGRTFTTNRSTSLKDGDAVLILSADAGG